MLRPARLLVYLAVKLHTNSKSICPLFIMSLIYPSLFFFFIIHMMLSFFLIPRCIAISDCLTDGSRISDGSSSTLVSPGKVFELGFFTPDESSNKNRYLGIWYYGSNPRIVVWVANREKPLMEPNGYLDVNHGNAKVLNDNNDGSISTHWKTDSDVTTSNSTRLCLGDNGNLILSSDQGKPLLWQSFDNPTDTILSGMILKGSLTLKSWQNRNDPAPGTTTLLLQPGKVPNMEITKLGYPQYWHSDKIPSMLSSLLVDGNGNGNGNDTRLVMNFTGQIQLWKLKSEGSWNLDWWEPKDRCSFDTVCGNFGSCNSNNGLPCKCLPGFKPSLQQEWDDGCFSGGCVAESGSPCQRNNFFNDGFLRLPMMKVGDGKDCGESTEVECNAQCLSDCRCVAYSYAVVNRKRTENSTEKRCFTWSLQLPRLQEEEYYEGQTLFVRTPSSDIEPTSRSCKPCGAYIIPYPLSTGNLSCGDSSYSNLHCNSKTGQLNFSTPTGNFKVTLIDPNTAKLSIQVMHSNSCDRGYIHSSVLSPNNSLPFYVQNCTVLKDDPLVQIGQPFIEVDIGWEPPLEPTCSASSDCFSWPHTTCKAAKGGKKRCICGSNSHWDGLKLTCTRARGSFPFKIVFPCVAAALLASLLLSIFFIYRMRRRRITKKKSSIKFKGEDTEGVDVPFFTWGTILSATKSFSDERMLGTGGFGSVYRGKLPDGKEIAVKRLSSVSKQGVAEFRTEVVLIARLQHRNLVRLLGYCVKSDENILVYEYMPNGSLDSCLFDNTYSVYLNWEKRLDIIFGIARGLVYLHQDSRLRIIHRDLKPSNILLDADLNPKISDFGIARIVGGKETEASTNKVVGTYGYMAPEYACEGYFSIKSDVFSFGVVVLETISGLRNSRTNVFEHGLSLLGHAWRLWTEDKALEFIDPTIKASCNPTEALKCIHVGLLCIQDDPNDRPNMPTVVLMLSNDTTMSQSLPKKPAYFIRTTSSETTSTDGSNFCSNLITISTVGR